MFFFFFSAYVELVYIDDAENTTRFKRTITVKSGKGVMQYVLDNKVVTGETYIEELGKIGVLVKAKNFLVFQVTKYTRAHVSQFFCFLVDDNEMCCFLFLFCRVMLNQWLKKVLVN